MAKVVKSVVRAVSKVVKGVVNAVKKVAKSKLGKIIIGAAAIYFGVPAVMGAFGAGGAAAAGGLSGLSGAAANIGAAWSSLGTAGSALLGGNLSGAASAIGSGFTGTAAAGGSALAGAAGTAAGTAGGSVIGGSGLPISAEAGAAMTKSLTAAGYGGTAAATAPVTAAATGGMGELAKYGLITSGTQLAGGLIQGYGQQKAMEEQRAYEEQAAAQRAQTIGTSLWGSAPTARVYGSPAAGPQYDPVAEARAINERRRAEFEAQYPTGGLVTRGMAAGGPMTNNNFPVYNPMYYRG